MRFPYQRDRSSLFGEIYRPVVEFEVHVNGGWIPIVAILDSGADITLLPKSFLDAFGFEPRKEEVKEVRGIGMIFAVEFRMPIAPIVALACYRKGLLVALADARTLFFSPPLILDKELADRGADILLGVCGSKERYAR